MIIGKRQADPPRVRGVLNVVGLVLVVGIFVTAAVRHHAWWYALGAADGAALAALAHSATAYPRQVAVARSGSFRTPLRPGA
ncbi:hypothetical protein V3N99_14380 [Dermatophilaceae bacterium Soc4.6]